MSNTCEAETETFKLSEKSVSDEVTVTVIFPLSAPASLSSGTVTETKNWLLLTALTVTLTLRNRCNNEMGSMV